jgi:conjugal transfer mating pair stabilization protein TraN
VAAGRAILNTGPSCNQEKDLECHLQKIDEEKCKLFTGEAKQCRKITGEFNCCAEKGLIKKLVGCNKQEEDLYTKQKAKICAYIGSWRGKGLERIKQQRSYCCFNSPLARIIQEQGRAQLNIGWGHTKNPDCRALTLSEIQKIDFSRIDFSELYADLKDKAVRDFGVQNNDIKQKLESYRTNPDELAKTMKGKMEKFYAKH